MQWTFEMAAAFTSEMQRVQQSRDVRRPHDPRRGEDKTPAQRRGETAKPRTLDRFKLRWPPRRDDAKR